MPIASVLLGVMFGVTGILDCAAQDVAATRAAKPGDSGPPSSVSRVEVTCDFEAPLLVAKVSEVLAAAIPVYEAEMGLRFPRGARMVMHVFGTPAAYAAAVARTGWTPPGPSGGYTLGSDRASYVIVDKDRTHVTPSGALPEWSPSIVLHEAAHQFAMKAVWYPLKALPDWYVEGQACWLAWRAETARGSAATTPEFAPGGYADAAAAAHAGHLLPPVDVLIAAETNIAPTLPYPQYAAWWSLYTFLADPTNGRWHRSFVQFQNDLRHHAWPDGKRDWRAARAEVQALFRARFPDLPALDRAWPRRPRLRAWVALEPEEGGACAEITCVGSARTTFRALKPDPMEADGFTVRGEFSLAAGYGAEVVVTVAHDEDAGTWLDVIVDARGELKLCGRGNGWSTTFATSRCPPLPPDDRWHPFEVGVHMNRIDAMVDGWAVSATVIPRWLKGTTRPGVGAKGATATFRSLMLAP